MAFVLKHTKVVAALLVQMTEQGLYLLELEEL